MPVLLCSAHAFKRKSRKSNLIFEIQQRARSISSGLSGRLANREDDEREAGGSGTNLGNGSGSNALSPAAQFPDRWHSITQRLRMHRMQCSRLKKSPEPRRSPPALPQWRQIDCQARRKYRSMVNRVHINPTSRIQSGSVPPARRMWLSHRQGNTWTPKTDRNSLNRRDRYRDHCLEPNPHLISLPAMAIRFNTIQSCPSPTASGVMVSNDGGTTWTQTGLNWQTSTHG